VIRALSGVSIVASALAFGVALRLPTVTFEKLGSSEETYSIVGGVRSLWEDGNWILAPIVFVFSVVLPVAKLLLLARIWLRRGSATWRRATVELLRAFGKWSMLDFFIVGTFVGSIKLGILADASSRVGIHVFAGAILVSMVAALLVERLVRAELSDGAEAGSRRELAPVPRGGPLARLVTLASLGCLVALALLPVVEVKKALFFSNEVVLPATTRRLAEDGELLLAAGLAVLVLATTLARGLVLLRLRWAPGASERTARIAIRLDEWAMLDVFALGLAIVYAKLDQLATATLLRGFWFVLAGAVLGQLDAWSFRRAFARAVRAAAAGGGRPAAPAPSRPPDR